MGNDSIPEQLCIRKMVLWAHLGKPLTFLPTPAVLGEVGEVSLGCAGPMRHRVK